ncbi:MAG: hypothetical protein AAFY82_00055 [Pseudomonadota bacterium]
MAEDDSFSMQPERLSEMYTAILDGDAARVLETAQQASSWNFTQGQVTMIIAIGLIYAIATLVRRLAPLGQPFANQIAENMAKPPSKNE